MKIAIIGYGKMGKEIEKTAVERGHFVNLIIDINNMAEFTPENLISNDIAIEFTTPVSAPENILTCLSAGIPVVAGTTGWFNHLPEVEKKCIEMEGALFHSSNFSPGVNIMFAVNEYLAQIMNSFPGYNVSITETHHTQKLDAPSGTAITLADQIIKEIRRKKKWIPVKEDNPESVFVKSNRKGHIKGIHEVIYDSDIDYLSLTHYAKSRRGFALGAVMAAEFLQDKKGIFTMRDLLGI